MVEEIGVLDGKLKTSYSNIRDAEESLLKSRNENLLIENDIRNVDYDSFKLDSILHHLEEDKNLLESEVDNLDREIDKLQQTLNKFIQERDKYIGSDKTENAKVKQIDEEINKTNEEIQSLIERIDSLNKQRNELYTDIQYTDNKYHESHDYLKGIKAKLVYLEDDNKVLQEDYANTFKDSPQEKSPSVEKTNPATKATIYQPKEEVKETKKGTKPKFL